MPDPVTEDFRRGLSVGYQSAGLSPSHGSGRCAPRIAMLVTARMQDGDQGVTYARSECGGGRGNDRVRAGDRTLMGLHFIIGAFLWSAQLCPSICTSLSLSDRLQVMTLALLMPFFFTLTGMRTVRLTSTPLLCSWEFFTIAIGAGAVGIIGGDRRSGAAHWRGDGRSVLGLGSLLQAKGLTETLIVLTVPLGCWDHLAENFLRHDSHGSLRHRACDAACSPGVRSLGYA